MSEPVLPALAALLEEARREGVAPALSAVVLRDRRVVHASCHGTVPAPEPRPLAPDDLFDVASLTKVLATTPVAALLVRDGVLSLDEPVAARLPGFARGDPAKARVTVRHLLAHTSGLPWWRPYFERVRADPVGGAAFLPPAARPPPAALVAAFRRGKELVREAVLAEPLEAAPGARAVYSDPGFLALGFLLEEVTGAPLPLVFHERVSRDLGLASTFFLDGLDPERSGAHASRRVFVPTEACEHRGEVNQGAVNDDNAWAMGGAAGHAGLFSTASEVARLGLSWLDSLAGRPGLVDRAVATRFAERDPAPGSTRALGWDTPSAVGSSFGTRLGRGARGAVGHLGFTGTSLWIDVDAEIVVALLTNRVHPTRENERIRAFRPKFHDAVAEALGIG